jgi:precorrin-3B methylase
VHHKTLTNIRREIVVETLLAIFSAFGLSASAGLNAYIPLLAVALLARFTNLITLSSPYDVLTSWWIIGLLLFLSLVEFFADTVPFVNHINDAIQTFIRPAAGAIAFAASAEAITEINPVISLAAGLLLAGGVHAIKAGVVRPAVTAATGGAANLPVKITEDFTAITISVLSIILPIIIAVFALVLFFMLVLFIWRRTARKKAHA